jgi:2-polyprenyl-6-methoxyphenol hydroxylase-like FAD-dependent oxidoreductase
MTAHHPITIVGGGLAGLSLGIALRRRNVPVTLWEAGRYPRHRVCGEFIRGRGLEVLERLGLIPQLVQAGARPATTARFFTPRHTGALRTFPEPALCLSRFELDALLAQEFVRSGGSLREQCRWDQPWETPGLVRTTGRVAEVQEHGRRWFGLKAHAQQVRLETDLEMHLQTNGYVGLCRLTDETVNVCGLFSRQAPAEPAAGRDWRERLCGVPGSPLWERLRDARFDPDSFCAVAGLGLRPHRAIARTECVLGDALTMIPPITGNGMSMAFEAAEVAAAHLISYSEGKATWDESRRRITQALDERFERRLRWAAWAHRATIHPGLGSLGLRCSMRSARVWQCWLAHTC